MPQPRISAQERRRMDAEIDALNKAAKDLDALFRQIAPYITETDPANLPFPEWGPDHWGLLLANIGGTKQDGATIERWTKQNPTLMLSLAGTLFRVGYAARQYEPQTLPIPDPMTGGVR